MPNQSKDWVFIEANGTLPNCFAVKIKSENGSSDASEPSRALGE